MKTYTSCNGERTFWLENGERKVVIADAYRFLAKNRIGSHVDVNDLELMLTCQEKAVNQGDYDESDPWEPMFSTVLYNEDGGTYCGLLEFFNGNSYIRSIMNEQAREFERRCIAAEEKRRHNELLAYLND